MKRGPKVTRTGLSLAIALALSGGAIAQQGAQFPFGGLRGDPSLPVEIAADNLEVSQADGAATFSGNVVIGQGEMRLSAGKVRVEYATADNSPGKIDKLHASGGVTLVSGAEAAEAQEAIYTIADGSVVMTGAVVLTQGQNVISGERLVVNLSDGTGRMEGRVRTVLRQDGN
jgi:lipopolysaccharide export system protein LptA